MNGRPRKGGAFPHIGRQSRIRNMSQSLRHVTETSRDRAHVRGRAISRNLRRQDLELKLAALQKDYAELHTAIFEAAQVHRRLCAPRHLRYDDFEIASEIFPVRHLSGDFFKVMQLDAVLGLALGDIAGKGLSAGIWQAHLMDLLQRYSRTYLHPTEVVGAVNRELCLNQNEPPITALFFARLDPDRNESPRFNNQPSVFRVVTRLRC